MNQGPPWHTVEAAIGKEMRWLTNVISTRDDPERAWQPSDGSVKHALDVCESTFRKIAILIVSGEVQAREFSCKAPGMLWGGATAASLSEVKHKHGNDWHHRMMDVLDNFFSKQGFEVTTEPNLNVGRSDLGVFMNGKKPLYVEVGTVSVYKLLANLSTMKGVVFLLVPDELRTVELETSGP